MSFYKKYELDRLMADGEAKSFRAVETATGRVVYLHLFNPSGRPLLDTLKSKLGGKGKPLPPLLELGEFAGSQYAVTEAIEPFGNLRDWIAAHVSTPAPLVDEDSSPALGSRVEDTPAPPPPRPPSLLNDGLGELEARFPAPKPPREPAAQELGEFTRMFEAPAPGPPPLPSPPRSPQSMPPASPEHGEFTRMFEPPPATPGPPPLPMPPQSGWGGEFTEQFQQPRPVQQSMPPAAPEHGEFTRMFEPPPATPGPPPLPMPPAAPEHGEFTRMFEPAQPHVRPSAPEPPPVPLVHPEPPAQASRPQWVPPAPSASEETGQFTRLFGGRMSGESIDIEREHASASQSTPPDSRPFQAAGDFTRMFGPQGVPGATALPRDLEPPSLNTSSKLTSASGMFGEPEELARLSKQVLSSPKPPTDQAVPGEYTRMFDNPRASEGPQPPPLPVKPQVQPVHALPKNSRRDLIVIGISVLVLVLLIVAAILFRRQ